jgi:hypothetical protein
MWHQRMGTSFSSMFDAGRMLKGMGQDVEKRRVRPAE